ncbi:hypothetical protein [Lysobacter sp. Root604]|uniref:hypothetical protein n=1 Tax=Lysobacter sp. Root604 TaxID=1736568 RepID=UPI0007149923|nr:hypothetical protein [Lysobacter sp. Root604]KRA14916.1 hypothetical protein ASD69_18760 [Lysobacter sp. Root604]
MTRRLFALLLGTLLLSLLAACSSPAPAPAAATDAAAPTAAPAAATAAPAPAPQFPAPGQHSEALEPVAIAMDLSCASDNDCVVKNVGNCCGQFNACVNRGSPADPSAVMAQCAKEGKMSMCGSPVIAGCACVQGQCRGVAAQQGVPM